MEPNNKRNKLAMITGVQPKILLNRNKNGNLEMVDEMENLFTSPLNYKLVREHDDLTKQSADIKWLEWDELGRFKASRVLPAVGLSLIMSPFNDAFTWQTTIITEILDLADDLSYIKFKTENSTYELFKL